MEREVVKRSEAKRRGLTRYFTGKTCAHGHTEERYVGDGACVECAREKLRRRYAEDPAKDIARVAAWGRANPERKLANQKAFYERNPEAKAKHDAAYRAQHRDKLNARQKERREADPEKSRACVRAAMLKNRPARDARVQRWKEANPERDRALRRAAKMARFAAKRNATPPWCERREINDFYERCPDGYEVDHIIPLQGKLVSGLHCLANLQYLTPSENQAKNNRFDPSTYTHNLPHSVGKGALQCQR